MERDLGSPSVTSQNGLYVAEFVRDPADWMVGDITGQRFANDDEREQLAQAVMAAIERVDEAEMVFSTCTDGRRRLKLEDGQPIPVREQLVGADAMTLFIMAEALGADFYEDPEAPIGERIDRVIDFGVENGLQPSTHNKCGAAGGFVPVIGNSAQFVGNVNYRRQQARIMGSAYDVSLHRQIAQGHQRRLENGLYAGYGPELITGSVLRKVGKHAIENYEDDGRGVHGHRELVRAYLKGLDGYAINPNALDVQVFGVNDNRIERLAALFGRGTTDDPNYRIALMAGEDFASAGHGTLANSMETIIIRPAV